MQRALVTVRYSIAGDPARFRHEMEKTAAMIAASPGLVWKIWGFDAARRVGVSAYLFDSAAAARNFIAGPAIKGLKSRADVKDVSVETAPIDQGLSERTGARSAIAIRATAAAGV